MSAEHSHGEIPEDQIERAKDRIVDVIRQHVSLKKAGKNWSGCCPFHKEKTPSFTVKEEERFYYCFGCGASGDAIGFLRDHLGISFRQAVESINGGITLEATDTATRKPVVRAVQCSLPGHAEDREKTARMLERCEHADQHPYLARNNTAPYSSCLQMKGALIVPLINNIGEEVNAAAITASSVVYAAGNPSYGSTAILEPLSQDQADGVTIICADYSHAWRLWWSRMGKSRILCAMDAGNLSWMLANCRDRFTHVGCDPLETEWYADELGYQVVALAVDPYFRGDAQRVATVTDEQISA